MLFIFLTVLKRDVLLSWRQGSAGFMVVAFFIIVTSLFPFAVGPDKVALAKISAGIIWVAALLSCLLSLDRIFHADYEDGSLDQYLLAPCPLEVIIFAKSLAHWVTANLPLIIIAPALGITLNLPTHAYGMLIFSMMIGTPALSFIGALGAALTVTLKRGGVLLSLLILPLYVPVLIFGVLCVEAAIAGTQVSSHMMLLAGVSLFSVALAPWAAAAAIRVGLE